MSSGTQDLFSPVTIGPYTLRNRMVMAPLTRNRAGEGNVPQAMNVKYYRQRASAGQRPALSRAPHFLCWAQLCRTYTRDGQ